MWIIMGVCIVGLLAMCAVAAFIIPEGPWQLVTIISSVIVFLIPCFYALKLEVSVGAYKCKKCGCQFVPTRQKGRSKQEKLLAVWMYAHGYSFRTIAKFFKVNVHSAFVWVKSFAEKNYSKPAPIDDSVVIELDEMWHFLRSKKTSLDLESVLPNNKTAHRLGVWRAKC